jgi:ribosomal protein RSM22 (predicted rRNA methylase)
MISLRGSLHRSPLRIHCSVAKNAGSKLISSSRSVTSARRQSNQLLQPETDRRWTSSDQPISAKKDSASDMIQYSLVNDDADSSDQNDDLNVDLTVDDDELDWDNEDDFIDDEPMPWKTLLGPPARASWRATHHTDPPEFLRNAQEKVLEEGGRTSKQLKRALRSILAKHSELAQLREGERRRVVNGNNKTVSDATAPVYYGPDETLASLKHRLYPNYSIAKRVLAECKSLLGPSNWTPKRIVDFGIGCGSSSAAALHIFDGIEWIHGIDPSQSMRECSRLLIEGIAQEEGRELVPRITFSRSLSAETATGSNNSSGSGGFDLAICAYTSTELPSVSASLAAAAILFQKLEPNGIFIMIEPGTPDGFNSIRAARNMLLDCCPPSDTEFEWKERCHIVAPCTHNGPCPMERHKKDFVKPDKRLRKSPEVVVQDDDLSAGNDSSDWDSDDNEDDFIDLSSHHGLMSQTDVFNSSFCSFVQTMPGAGPLKKGEKFSYLVAQKRVHNSTVSKSQQQPHHLFGDVNISDMLARAHDAAYQKDQELSQKIFQDARDLASRYLDSDDDYLGLELLSSDQSRMSHGRIIRAPIKKRGHIYIDYCASPGRIIRKRVTKGMSNNVAPGIFAAARKSRWGGYWPDIMDRVFSKNESNKT